MDNKLQLFNFEGQPVLDSRNVAEIIGKRHDNLVRDIDRYILDIEESSKLRNGSTTVFFIPITYISKQNFKGFEEDQDFTSVSVDTEVQNNGDIQKRELQDYLLTIDMAKELCMMSKTKKDKGVSKIQTPHER